jgi:uncharacterized protein (TIGR02001 family)
MDPHERQQGATTGRGRRPWRARLWIPALLALLALPALLPRAQAQDAWSASAAATSDYVLRGVSQSYDHVALQTGFNYRSTSGAFAGAWGSNVNPYPFLGSAVELDLYAGYSWTLTQDFSAQSTYTRYTYLDDPRLGRYDFDELAFSFKYLDRLAFTWSWQPDVSAYSALGSARDRSVLAYELSGLWPVRGGLTVLAGVGYYDLHRLFGVGYAAGSAGLGWISGHFEIDLVRYASQATVARLYEQASANGNVVLSGIFRF